APYLVTSALFLAALAPLALAPKSPPDLAAHGRMRLGPLVAAAPVATIAALVFGAVETGAFSQLPLYGLRIGLSEPDAALLITWTVLGNLAFQIPLGALSDRIDRRIVLFACSLFGALGCALMPAVSTMPLPQAVLLFFWGGIIGAIYTVGLAHLGARFSGADIAQANAAFVMLYSFGLIAGPPYVGAGMDALGSVGFPLTMGALIAAYAALVGWRLARGQA
ncbi:MAG TPA: MFS transporter, partial [Beijerinckiaceae bacterium]|nr:MFS transporter [Beijerinckiaceae bacterium]